MTQRPPNVTYTRELELRWYDAQDRVVLVWATESEDLGRHLLDRRPAVAVRGELVERHVWATLWSPLTTA